MKIPLTNIISVATDGAPAMVGRHRGFLAYLKQAIPNVLSVHCVIHRHHLVAKNLSERLHESLHYDIRAVNKIKRNLDPAKNRRFSISSTLERKINNKKIEMVRAHPENGECKNAEVGVLKAVGGEKKKGKTTEEMDRGGDEESSRDED